MFSMFGKTDEVEMASNGQFDIKITRNTEVQMAFIQ